jgi:hypothetical protein
MHDLRHAHGSYYVADCASVAEVAALVDVALLKEVQLPRQPVAARRD